MKKKILFLFTMIFCSHFVWTQNNTEKFWKLFNSKRNEEATKFLDNWIKKNKKDPEVYLCYFDMYLSMAEDNSMHKVSFLPDDFSGEYVESRNRHGQKIYTYYKTTYDPDLCKKCFEYINKGLSYNPKRLDLHYKKAQLYFSLEDYEEFYDTLKKVLDLNKKYKKYLKHNKYKKYWLWTNNEPIITTNISIEETFHDFLFKLYMTDNEKAYIYMKKIALQLIDQYPKSPTAYKDAGLSFILLEDFDAAKTYYKKAYLFDSEDKITLSNLARVCFNTGDKANAKKYFEKLASLDEGDYSDYAAKILKDYF